MLLNNNLLLKNATTTADGKRIFWGIGDSFIKGNSSAAGVTCSAGTFYDWSGTTETEITSSDVPGATGGSFWPGFGKDYNTRTGFKAVLVNSGSPGSTFYPEADNNNWYTSGDLYTAARSKLVTALAHYGITIPAGIVIHLGINDARGSQSLTDIDTGISSLFSRLITDYPNTPIYVIQPGRTEATLANTTRTQHIRIRLLEARDANSNVHVVTALSNFVAWGYYNTDNLHLLKSGNDALGAMISRYINTSTTASKTLRSIYGIFETELSAPHKTLVATFVSSVNWDKVNMFYNFYKADSKNNAACDWTLISGGNNSAWGYNASGGITFNGTTEFFQTGFLCNGDLLDITTSDVFVASKALVATTAAGTAAYLFGGNAGTSNIIRILQGGGSTIGYGCLDATASSYATDTKIQAGVRYGVGRTTSNVRHLYKDGSTVANATVTVVSMPSRQLYCGAYNNNGTAANFWEGETADIYVLPYTENQSTFDSALNTLQSSW